ncbi:MAG: class II aldolase/adducin family protein [SAR324 cluster bacterium]|nr:class II aldolase/adducin family protein [SAR324 cluster bacterium]
MDAIKDLVEISKYAGERIDIVQAGGGNSSVKNEQGQLIIKASGFTLSDLTMEKGYAKVDNQKVLDLFATELPTDKKAIETSGNVALTEAHLEGPRASIETFLHALTLRVTLHSHPIIVNLLVAQKDCEKIIHKLFPEALLVPYFTPGLELGLAFDLEYKKAKETGKKPKVAFFKNHGLLVTGDTVEEVIELNEQVLLKLEAYFKLDMSEYRNGSQVSKLVNETCGTDWIGWKSTNPELTKLWGDENKAIKAGPLFPDQMVFNGHAPVWLANFTDGQAIKDYQTENISPPKMAILGKDLYLLAPNLKKAKEMEDVLLSQLLVFSKLEQSQLDFLSKEELSYLDNWESEKYRQKI